MRAAKTGDVVVKITCRCGVQLVALSDAPTWTCTSCRMRGRGRTEHRLLDAGVEGDAGGIRSAPPTAPAPLPSPGTRRLVDRAVSCLLAAFPGAEVVTEGRCRYVKGKAWCEGEGEYETPDGGRWCRLHFKLGMGRWKRAQKQDGMGSQLNTDAG